MASFSLPYGRSSLNVHLPDSRQVEVLAPARVSAAADPIQAVRDALKAPLGGICLQDFAEARSVAIAINDKTRPVPHDILLPPLLEEFSRLGIPREAITFIVATGLHAPMDRSEFDEILPREILSQYRVISHDSEARQNLVHRGTTKRGTPVWINRAFAEADCRMVAGNLEPHQFMGFSGGVKSAAIGLAGMETINANHAMMLDPRSRIAAYEDNPARQDVEEIGELIGIHFALNDVLDEEKRVVRVFAGEPRAVMKAGIPSVLEIYQARVSVPFDLMIVSPGGHPKDINLYQAQKALGHASLVTKPEGTIILTAACPEGTGSRTYENWVLGMKSSADVIDRFKREGYRTGPHKAFQIARDSLHRRVILVSDMKPDFMRRLVLTPSSTAQEALDLALNNLQPNARIGIMPFANATIPELESAN